MGENSPNLVTLLSIKQNVFTDGWEFPEGSDSYVIPMIKAYVGKK
jgi:hypothetical protein